MVARCVVHRVFPVLAALNVYSRRSSRLSTLPLGFRGRPSRQTAPLIRCCLPTRALVHSTSSSIVTRGPAEVSVSLQRRCYCYMHVLCCSMAFTRSKRNETRISRAWRVLQRSVHCDNLLRSEVSRDFGHLLSRQIHRLLVHHHVDPRVCRIIFKLTLQGQAMLSSKARPRARAFRLGAMADQAGRDLIANALLVDLLSRCHIG